MSLVLLFSITTFASVYSTDFCHQKKKTFHKTAAQNIHKHIISIWCEMKRICICTNGQFENKIASAMWCGMSQWFFFYRKCKKQLFICWKRITYGPFAFEREKNRKNSTKNCKQSLLKYLWANKNLAFLFFYFKGDKISLLKPDRKNSAKPLRHKGHMFARQNRGAKKSIMWKKHHPKE